MPLIKGGRIASKRVDGPCRSSVVGTKGKLDSERRAAMIAISCRYQPMVRFDNGARDGQPHAHAW